MFQISKSILCLVVFACGVLSLQAKGLKPAGELASANGATINNSLAHSGSTIFSNSRIKTAASGTAVVNLGRLGRVELGPNSDLTLQFSNGVIGGTLNSGKLIVSTLNNVQVNISTPDGSVTSASPQSARFVVDLANGRTNVVANRGAAKLTSRGNVSIIGVVNGGQVQGISRNAPEAKNNSAAKPNQDATMSNLLRASANEAAEAAISDRANRQKGGFFYTSITCKDYTDNPKCVKRSPAR
jgi:ferric-dicitrate binding protein FerR (iron transport regulator)